VTVLKHNSKHNQAVTAMQISLFDKTLIAFLARI